MSSLKGNESNPLKRLRHSRHQKKDPEKSESIKKGRRTSDNKKRRQGGVQLSSAFQAEQLFFLGRMAYDWRTDWRITESLFQS